MEQSNGVAFADAENLPYFFFVQKNIIAVCVSLKDKLTFFSLLNSLETYSNQSICMESKYYDKYFSKRKQNIWTTKKSNLFDIFFLLTMTCNISFVFMLTTTFSIIFFFFALIWFYANFKCSMFIIILFRDQKRIQTNEYNVLM